MDAALPMLAIFLIFGLVALAVGLPGRNRRSVHNSNAYTAGHSTSVSGDAAASGSDCGDSSGTSSGFDGGGGGGGGDGGGC